MIKFGKKSWHRRIITWGLGREYLEYYDWNEDGGKYDLKEKDNINLCPYMRHLIGVFLISPWIALYKILPKYCKEDHPDMTKIFLAVGSICAIIHVLGTQVLEGFEWWYVPVGTAIMTGMISGILGLIFGCMALRDWLDDRPESHKSNLIKEYMKAKHDKVCPQVKFVD